MSQTIRSLRGARFLATIFLSLFIYGLPLHTGAHAAVPLRERISLNADWRFQKGDPAGAEGQLVYAKIKDWITTTGNEFVLTSGAAKPNRPAGNLGDSVSYTERNFDDTGWRQLNLPHDWGIEGPFNQDYPGETGKLPWWGVAWYRKHFTVPAADKGKRLMLEIDGAMSYATVWLNGKFVGGWPYGYASFALDLTPYIEFGAENVLAIRLDNPPDSSRWYPGGGIYRNVWLVKTAPVHVAHWGTYVTTPDVSASAATVNIRTTIDNDTASPASLTLKTQIYEYNSDAQKLGAAVATVSPLNLKVPAGSSEISETSIRVTRPKLWNLQRPNLYEAVTTIEQDGKLVDRYETTFGIRTIKFDTNKGFFLNGEHVRLNGVCDHHDLGPLGSALNLRALERQLQILKEMGVNAIRTSHNPPAPELLELCDRMGLVVMDEAFDCWRRGKKKNDYHLLFDDWHEKDWRAELRRDRNHPSIILWSTGNEIGEQRTPEGQKVAEELVRIAHEEDPTRPATAACNYTEAGYNGFQKVMDVFGYNYRPTEYGKFHESNPTIPLFASETASTVSTRGEYFFPVSDDKSKGLANFQVSSYDLYAPRWATPPDAEFKGQDEFPFVAGEFVWTGFDYLGEPTPYGGDSKTLLNFTDASQQSRAEQELKQTGKIKVPSRSSYFGIVDLDGFKKDRFYIYQARWRPDFPMAHILPHWNWPERKGQVTPVHVYTSGDEAELFLNGRSLGRKKKGQFEYRLRWDDVVYEPGELRVVAYKNGKRWAEDVVKTTGAQSRLTLKADRSTINADGQDLSFITVTVADKEGLLVPRSRNRVRFEISGPGEIVAVDNGDPTSLESFQSKERAAFNGLVLVIVRAKAGQPGNIRLKAQADGLSGAEILIRSVASASGRK
ncbi:MAG TPA: beta-galactosidase GalB [Pyrinomonadaceae bacterium]|nr:beta-galactosidase GalB [Pyrinomonadaceae bacterium]